MGGKQVGYKGALSDCTKNNCSVKLRSLVSVLQDPTSWVNIHHLEYTDGGILDPDDVLADVVEDKDKVELG